MSTCSVPGCSNKITHGIGLCNHHSQKKKIHGHAEQAAIPAPLLHAAVQDCRESLDLQRDILVDANSCILSRIESKCLNLLRHLPTVGVSVLNRAHGYEAVLAVLREHTEPDRVLVEEPMGYGWLRAEQPTLWRDDRAFAFSVAKRVYFNAPNRKRDVAGKPRHPKPTVFESIFKCFDIGELSPWYIGAVGYHKSIAQGCRDKQLVRAVTGSTHAVG